MPAVASAAPDPQEPDWPGIRAASVAVGVREAARQASKHLPPEEQERFVFRVLKRSQREGWVAATKEAMIYVTSQAKPLSSPVLSGSDVLKESLAEDSKETRISLSKAARNLAKKGEDADLHQAGDVLQVGKLAALTHGWEQAGGSSVSINLLIQ